MVVVVVMYHAHEQPVFSPSGWSGVEVVDLGGLAEVFFNPLVIFRDLEPNSFSAEMLRLQPVWTPIQTVKLATTMRPGWRC